MPLYAIAGGAPSGGALIYFCCCHPFLFLLLIAVYGVYRRSILLTLTTFAFDCIFFVTLLQEVARQVPSEDWEVAEEQSALVNATYLVGILTAGMGVALIIVVWQSWKAKSPPRKEPDVTPTAD